MASDQEDLTHMRHALRLAARGLGRVAPNPAVGCVIVSSDGVIVGRGWTGAGGRPHAEALALRQAEGRARNATAYVTLEPCAHHGVTPPCAEALAGAGIARVVGAMADPDPRVAGRGYRILAKEGVSVTTGVCEVEARELNSGFLKRVEKGLPLVALKVAQSIDGFVADAGGKQRWITAEPARRRGHFLRAQHDAILVGIETAVTDDPLLTCRIEGLEDRSPLRVVVDSRLRLSTSSQLARTARLHPVLLFTAGRAGGEPLEAMGVEILRAKPDQEGRPDMETVLRTLAERGITRLLVEGGPTVQAALLDCGLADRLYLFLAPDALGSGVASAMTKPGQRGNDRKRDLMLIGRERLGPDWLESYAITD